MDATRDWQSNKSVVMTNRIMFEKEIATDVTFSFPNSKKEVKAHKYVLMSRSHVFFRMFTTSGFQDSQGQINIEDIEPDMFKDFLRFLYCDDVRKVEKTNALHMLYSAEKYGITALRVECLKQLVKNINGTTVALFLETALLYNAHALKKKCLGFLSKPCNDDLGVLTHHHISLNTLKVLLGKEAICSNKVAVFEACNKWASDECVKQSLDPTSGNKREVLGDILTKIPFHQMSVEEFANHVSPAGLLTLEEEVQIFRLLASGKRISPLVNVSKSSVRPVVVKLPTNINIPNCRSNGYVIEIKCCKKFRLVGFSFRNVGKFHMRINNKCEEFSVSQAGIYMTGQGAMDHELIIMDQWMPKVAKRHGDVPFSVKCKDGQVEVTGTAYISTPLPFEGLLVDFS